MRSVILASLIACFTIDSIAFKSKKSYNYDLFSFNKQAPHFERLDK